MGRNAQLIRQWAILKQIETNRWTTISDLAESHIVSTNTIRRDLAALMEAGFPLCIQKNRKRASRTEDPVSGHSRFDDQRSRGCAEGSR